jgi:hypothetical protein
MSGFMILLSICAPGRRDLLIRREPVPTDYFAANYPRHKMHNAVPRQFSPCGLLAPLATSGGAGPVLVC